MTQLPRLQKKQLINIGLLTLILICSLLFFKLTHDVFHETTLPKADLVLATQIYRIRNPALTLIMIGITNLASAFGVSIISGIAILTLVKYNHKKYLIPLVFTIVGSTLFVETVKLYFARARPLAINALVTETTFSYPSGHSLMAITFFGILVIYYCLLTKNILNKVIAATIGIITIISVGFSRIYLGVHWPSDVLASYLLGTCWLSIILLGFNNKEGFAPLIR